MRAKILGLCICTLIYVINLKYLINYKHKYVDIKIADI